MREWIDGRFGWLAGQFGQDVPARGTVVLPTPAFFPDRYDAKNDDDARVMLERVAGYMNVDPQTLKLTFYSEGDPDAVGRFALGTTNRTAGLYFHRRTDADGQLESHATIGIERGQLADPMSLVATLAHEIGHEILLGQGRVNADDPDHEPLTDLLTIFLGMGIFTANATIRDRGWTSGGWSGWRTSRHGYLSQREVGYALARFAFTRGELKPPWAKHVRPDVRLPMREGLGFLASGA
jgi:hypothetical protein